jgi:hypothetical protein
MAKTVMALKGFGERSLDDALWRVEQGLAGVTEARALANVVMERDDRIVALETRVEAMKALAREAFMYLLDHDLYEVRKRLVQIKEA